MTRSRPLVIGLVAILVLSSLASWGLGGFGAAAASPTHPAPAGAASAPGASAPRIHPPSGNPPPSGPGSFFLNFPLAVPPAANQSCVYNFACNNYTGNPSITTTPAGLIAVASTTMSNVGVCAGDTNLTSTEIEIQTTSNNGTTWSSPVYLSNPDCTTQFNYSSAMWPSITALPNGTLVLAFVEYNLTASTSSLTCNRGETLWFPDLFPCMVASDRVVVTRSYTSGATWTLPTPIDTSNNTLLNEIAPLPMQPDLTSQNNTVYLAWDSMYDAVFDAYFSAPTFSPIVVTGNLSISSNGGQTWGASVAIPAINNSLYTTNTSMVYAPALAIAPNGTLYVAYASNLTGDSTTTCIGSFGCTNFDPTATMDVEVASTTNGGTSFTLSTAAHAVPIGWNGNSNWLFSGPSNQVAPSPAIAVDPGTGNVYVAYTGNVAGLYCFAVGSCFVQTGWENLWVATSTSGGTSWTNASLGTTLIQNQTGSAGVNDLMTPSVGVGTNGTVWVNAVFDQGSVCTTQCGLWSDELFQSTDHGATFAAFEPDPGSASELSYPLWVGATTSLTIFDGQPWVAWTQEYCPPTLTYCGYSGSGSSYVIVTTPFSAVGVTLTFSQSGIPTGANWSVNLGGNVRFGPSSGSLSVSRVPTNYALSWSETWVNTTTYGTTFQPGATTPPSGSSFTSNTTITVPYSERVLVNILTVPRGYSGHPFTCISLFFNQYCAPEVITPGVGGTWVPVGTPMAYGVAPLAGFSFSNCGYCMNLTFLSWTGVGNGSWNSTVANGSATINGPVNETVNFNLLNICDFGFCTNLTFNYEFVENGLPNATAWSVTLAGQVGTSSTPSIGFNASGGPLPFTIWAVPYNATYSYVGVPSFPSPITSTQGGQEVVNFTLQAIARGASTLTVWASGLPSGVTTWGLDLGPASIAAPAANSTHTLPNGATILNASPAYGQNGIGGYLTGFTVSPEVVGASGSTVLPGGSYTFDGPAVLEANFAPEYWVTVDHTAGGTVSVPAGQWVHAGGAVTLNATPAAGFAFVGWSGTGPGSSTSNALSITVHPGGPITELATFVAVVPTFSVSVNAIGIPGAVPVTVQVGGTAYTEAAPFVVSGLVAGSYSVSVPTVYPNGTVGTRYVLTALSSSLSLSGGSIDVTANGTLSLTYQAQYALTVGTTANGTTTPGPGTYWEPGGVVTPLTALPAFAFNFAGWVGIGPGSVTDATNATINVTLSAPVTETASFSAIIRTPPATFNLTVTETGLPAGTLWSASTGSTGSSSTTSTLVISGLNGTYTITVPYALGAPGVRYAPDNLVGYPETMTSNGNLAVTFSTQYLVTVESSPGGTVTPGTGWVTSGSTVALTATANSTSYVFVAWNGTGAGSYSGKTAATSFTASGPVTEVATFTLASNTVSPSSSSSSSSPLLAIGVLVGLLVVGLVVGLLIGRSRPPSGPRAPPVEEWSAPETAEPSPVWEESSAEQSPMSETGEPAGGQDETIYGGGSA